MRILIFHGYLLRGTGSNVYNANVAQALARLGHDVHLLCQDHEAAALPWVDAVGTWEGGALTVEPAGDPDAGRGSVTAYLPDIGGLLPVYVEDRYEGFRVKPFPEMTEEELEAYLDANVAAVSDVAGHAGGIDGALANHLVMGPVILARAGLDYAVKIHGSALSYTVKPHPRFLPHAREGLEPAQAILVGSRHTAADLWATLGDASVERRTRLGPPGVDIEAFSPPGADEAPAAALAALAAELRADRSASGAFARDTGRAADALESFAAAEGARVAFIGKLIVSKGCDLLLAAWPLVHAANPGARLLMVGFGEYEDGLGRLWAALGRGDLAEATELARAGRGLEGGEHAPLRFLTAFLENPPDGYAAAARVAAGSIDFAGRLEYGEVARVVRHCDAKVVPSTFPEAFGMVAAEAAACGVLPVCADHSGLAEVAGALAAELPAEPAGLLAFPLDDGAVESIAARLVGWLGLERADREAASATLASTARRLWSWEGVAEGVIAAGRGDLDRLSRVPDR